MSLKLKVCCYHKEEPVDEETGLCPSHEMILDSITLGEAIFVCPDCRHEVYVLLSKPTSGGTPQ